MALHLIHTADWHLGQTFFGYDREVEHDAFLAWLTTILTQRQTDVLLIAGDVFDVANPSAAAQRRFYRFLKEANRLNPGLQIVAIAGNHDSAIRLEAPVPLLEELNIRMIGTVKRTDTGEIDLQSLVVPLCDRAGRREAWCLAVPFLRQGDYPPADVPNDTYGAGVGRMYKQLSDWAVSRCTGSEAVVATGHLYATGAELSEDDRSERILVGGLDSVSADVFDCGLAYTALGHVHKAQRVGGKETVRYAGSPLPMSFSEKNYKHQVIEVTLENGRVGHIESLEVPLVAPLLRIPERPVSPEAVLEALEALPTAGDTDLSVWPYVEVRVLLTEPEPGFRHRVEEVLKDKAVRLTSIIPFYPERTEKGETEAMSLDGGGQIDPLAMLEHVFEGRYGGELPVEMKELFTEVLREIDL